MLLLLLRLLLLLLLLLLLQSRYLLHHCGVCYCRFGFIHRIDHRMCRKWVASSTKEFICISTLHFYIQRSSYKFQTLHSLHFYIQRSSYVFPLYIQRSSYVFRLFLKPSPGRVVSLPPARQNKEIFFCPSYRSQRLSGYLQKKVWTMTAAPPHGG